MSKVTHLPEPGVVLDLDVEERPEKDIRPPFVVRIEGREVTMADPDEVNWRELAYIETPEDLLRVSLSKEDREFLKDLDLPTWKFRKFIDSYYAHYNLEDKIKAAQRRAKSDF